MRSRRRQEPNDDLGLTFTDDTPEPSPTEQPEPTPPPAEQTWLPNAMTLTLEGSPQVVIFDGYQAYLYPDTTEALYVSGISDIQRATFVARLRALADLLERRVSVEDHEHSHPQPSPPPEEPETTHHDWNLPHLPPM